MEEWKDYFMDVLGKVEERVVKGGGKRREDWREGGRGRNIHEGNKGGIE